MLGPPLQAHGVAYLLLDGASWPHVWHVAGPLRRGRQSRRPAKLSSARHALPRSTPNEVGFAVLSARALLREHSTGGFVPVFDYVRSKPYGPAVEVGGEANGDQCLRDRLEPMVHVPELVH